MSTNTLRSILTHTKIPTPAKQQKNVIYKIPCGDCSKYITSCSLSLDLMLKYTGVKIELVKDISIFDYVNDSIFGGICKDSQNISDDKDGVISSCDVCSLHPHVMTKKLLIGNYKFIKYFNRNRYLDSDYSCLLNCEVNTTSKVRNNSILKQFPALISRTPNKYDNLSEFQRKNLKETINHLKN